MINVTESLMNKLVEMQQAKTEALAKMPQDAYDRIKTALLNKLNGIDNSFEGLLKNLLLIAANWKQLGMPAINGLVAYAVAGELLLESQQVTTEELTETPKNNEAKEEVKQLHFVATSKNRTVKGYDWKTVVRSIRREATEYHEPIAVKHYRATLMLAHLMETGRLCGKRIEIKIHGLNSMQTCKLIVEMSSFIESQQNKMGYLSEHELIQWICKKARKDPWVIVA